MSPSSMRRSVLGIDAAWAQTNPSGVALVVRENGRPAVVAVAPSFEGFVAKLGESVPESDAVTLDQVIRAAERRAGGRLNCIALDIPLSSKPIRGRRAADAAISRAFGGMKCAAHSPSAKTPGAWGRQLQKSAEGAGYELRVAGDPPGLPRMRSLIEVYPHPALLRLCGAAERLPYKDKAAFSPDVRRQAFAEIVDALKRAMDDVPVSVLIPGSNASRRDWKGCEDALDAIVCCWIGLEFLSQRAIPYGDRDAAVWVPAAASA